MQPHVVGRSLTQPTQPYLNAAVRLQSCTMTWLYKTWLRSVSCASTWPTRPCENTGGGSLASKAQGLQQRGRT